MQDPAYRQSLLSSAILHELAEANISGNTYYPRVHVGTSSSVGFSHPCKPIHLAKFHLLSSGWGEKRTHLYEGLAR